MLLGCSECTITDKFTTLWTAVNLFTMLAPAVHVYNPAHAISCPLVLYATPL